VTAVAVTAVAHDWAGVCGICAVVPADNGSDWAALTQLRGTVAGPGGSYRVTMTLPRLDAGAATPQR